MEPPIVALISVVGTLVVVLLGLFLASGGRLGLGWRVMRDPALAEKVQVLLAPLPEKPKKPSGAPIRVLALLQRDGRLLDFLLEDIKDYGDAQVGAAVRDIHRQCQAALKEHITLEPVMRQEEGSAVEVSAGFDPSAIRLTGNVTGQPPFKGTLRHHGWRVKDMKLGPPPEGQDELVLMPAEVELP